MGSNNNNLFRHAGKEFVMDAFLCWLIEEEKQNDKLAGFREEFLEDFLEVNPDGKVQEIKAEKQKNNIDVLITIETDQDKHEVLMENKMWSNIHGRQLGRYKENHPNAAAFIYWKLGYLHRKERKQVRNVGYEIRGPESLNNILENYVEAHPFIKEFNQFLNTHFIGLREKIKNDYQENRYEELQHAPFQQYVTEKIYDQLTKNGFADEELSFLFGTNRDGTPWSHLTFSQLDEVYDQKQEVLFFRIDKRSDKFYLRVNQYSKDGKKYWPKKKNRMQKLREAADELKDDISLNFNSPHNRASNEVEILILFFEDGNTIEKVVSKTPQIAKKLKSVHQKL